MTDRITFAGSVEAVEGRLIKGSVQIAGSRTFRNGEWLEVDPGALVRADAKNVVGRFDHDPGKVLGRISNGTLRLSRTEQGIDYEIDVNDTTFGNDALAMARRGDFGGSSFEIEGLRSQFSTDPDGTRVRRITSIKRLTDVSPVIDPAFVNSTVAAFGNHQETEVAEDTTEQAEDTKFTVGAPNTAAAPVAAVITPKDDKSETFRTAEAFAKRQDTKSLETAMANIIATGLETKAEQETYDAFAAEYDKRSAVDGEAKERAARIRLSHDLRTGKGPKAPEGRSEVTESDDYAQAFSQYLRTGRPELMEQFAQSIAGDGTQGGFTVPDGFLAKVTTRLKDFGGIAGVADEITTATGESLRWPYLDDTSNKAAIASENTAPASGGADLVFDSIELGAFSYAATGASNVPLRVSLELVQDSSIDITGRISAALGERIGRKQADHLATGAGGTEPVGLLSKSADTMTATVVSLAGPEHIFQVDRAYRDNARWVMSDTTLAKLWTAQATTNEPLFQPGRTLDGKPFDVFFGYPITIDASAGNLVAFGDIKAGYIIRRVRGVQVLVDPYTRQSTREVCYYAWARMDANIQDANAYSVSSWSGVSADT